MEVNCYAHHSRRKKTTYYTLAQPWEVYIQPAHHYVYSVIINEEADSIVARACKVYLFFASHSSIAKAATRETIRYE